MFRDLKNIELFAKKPVEEYERRSLDRKLIRL